MAGFTLATVDASVPHTALSTLRAVSGGVCVCVCVCVCV